jgi:hypothetical protein
VTLDGSFRILQYPISWQKLPTWKSLKSPMITP